MISLLVGASLAWAAARLASLEPMRVVAKTMSPIGKLVACPYCLGFWTCQAAMAALRAKKGNLVGWFPLTSVAAKGAVTWPDIRRGSARRGRMFD